MSNYLRVSAFLVVLPLALEVALTASGCGSSNAGTSASSGTGASGASSTGASTGSGAPTGTTNCGGVCVDNRSDPQNCGTCGHACASGEACVAGACGQGCPTGTTKCGSDCVDTQGDSNNCGGCNTACTSGSCYGGACVVSCSAGQCPAGSVCAAVVTQKHTDPQPLCLPGTACPAGMQSCSGVCRDTARDDAACGGCDRACEAGTLCHGGTCVHGCCGGFTTAGGGGPPCQAPMVDCGGTCVDVSFNQNNCGACGKVCNCAETCTNGTCAPECGAGELCLAGAALNGDGVCVSASSCP